MSLVDHLTQRQPKSAWMRLMKTHPDYFHEAVALALSGKNRESWRAAWLVYHNMHRNDQRLQPLLQDLIRALRGKESGHQRELLKVIGKMEIQEGQQGFLFDECLRIWEDLSKQSSVRITAFNSMADIAWRYPELKAELLQFSSHEYSASLSPGIKASFEKRCEKIRVSIPVR